MTAVGVSERELERLRPRDVEQYLSSRGWRPGRQVRYSRRWERDWAGRPCRVLLPLDSDLADYADRMAELITALAEIEGRQPVAVHQDLTLTGLDVQYIRTLPRTPSGTIPVQAAVLAVTSARDLLMAAACDTVLGEPRSVQPRRKPQQAKEFVDSARFGPTAPGSYVFTVQVPLPERTSGGRLFDDDPSWDLAPEPFARRVSRRMYETMAVARRAAEVAMGSVDADPFSEAVENGLSADLCEALAGIGGNDGRREAIAHGFSVAFGWSSRWPTPRESEPLHFSPRLVDRLREGAQELRRQAPERGVTIMGRSTVLRRASARGPGEVTVEAVVMGPEGPTGPRRQVRVHLSEAAYNQAAAVHGHGAFLQIEGDLTRRGNFHELTRVTGFSVL
ncbi:hypothetical protein AB0C77_02895 [Streptomyces sp. NPDC048629]|uniref:hypothetical protein n=1 Tax=Streptomyces sp. NPDC048629 TaxID=3154824 RepID=UPI00342DE5A3